MTNAHTVSRAWHRQHVFASSSDWLYELYAFVGGRDFQTFFAIALMGLITEMIFFSSIPFPQFTASDLFNIHFIKCFKNCVSVIIISMLSLTF